MSRPVFYRNVNGEEVMAPIKDIPSKCDDCCYVAIREEYRDYDDLEGLDIYDKYISCNANGMLLCKCRVEGSNHYDYGYETRTLAEKPDNCPLY
ncbi:hypothetical protein LJC63_02060 [Ruminococcaceae bacterium OttesenSCG-928-L11]|nr:hypothetical protein [Ruminococcaceae bacterium OttesenSCG-928-L11]